MRTFNLTFFVLFLLAAALQYNDPDPYLWIPIYLYGAVLCWLAFRKKFYPSAYLLGIIVYSAYAGFKLFEPEGAWDWITKHRAQNIAGSMKAANPWIEETREFFALIILITVLLVDYFYARKKMNNDNKYQDLKYKNQGKRIK